MSDGVITRSGRVLLARLLHGDALPGLTHCALGDGDASFTDPAQPPVPSSEQTGMRHERVRKTADRHAYLLEDPAGEILVNGVAYREASEPTPLLGVFFRFEESEANGFPIKEYGFFGGGVTYVTDINGPVATGGVYHATTNPTGQVLTSGYLYEVWTIPDLNKTNAMQLQLVGVIGL